MENENFGTSNDYLAIITTPDGDCGLHAILGAWDKNAQEFKLKKSDLNSIKNEIKQKIPNLKAEDPIYKLVLAEINQVTCVEIRNKIKKLFEQNSSAEQLLNKSKFTQKDPIERRLEDLELNENQKYQQLLCLLPELKNLINAYRSELVKRDNYHFGSPQEQKKAIATYVANRDFSWLSDQELKIIGRLYGKKVGLQREDDPIIFDSEKGEPIAIKHSTQEYSQGHYERMLKEEEIEKLCELYPEQAHIIRSHTKDSRSSKNNLANTNNEPHSKEERIFKVKINLAPKKSLEELPLDKQATRTVQEGVNSDSLQKEIQASASPEGIFGENFPENNKKQTLNKNERIDESSNVNQPFYPMDEEYDKDQLTSKPFYLVGTQIKDDRIKLINDKDTLTLTRINEIIAFKYHLNPTENNTFPQESSDDIRLDPNDKQTSDKLPHVISEPKIPFSPLTFDQSIANEINEFHQLLTCHLLENEEHYDKLSIFLKTIFESKEEKLLEHRIQHYRSLKITLTLWSDLLTAFLNKKDKVYPRELTVEECTETLEKAKCKFLFSLIEEQDKDSLKKNNLSTTNSDPNKWEVRYFLDTLLDENDQWHILDDNARKKLFCIYVDYATHITALIREPFIKAKEDDDLVTFNSNSKLLQRNELYKALIREKEVALKELETELANLKNQRYQRYERFVEHLLLTEVKKHSISSGATSEGYSLALMSTNQPTLTDEKLKQISKEQGKIPLLIKKDDQFLIWGYLKGEWQRTMLNKEDLAIILKYFNQTYFKEPLGSIKKITILKSSNIFDILKKGHTPFKLPEVYNRLLSFQTLEEMSAHLGENQEIWKGVDKNFRNEFVRKFKKLSLDNLDEDDIDFLFELARRLPESAYITISQREFVATREENIIIEELLLDEGKPSRLDWTSSNDLRQQINDDTTYIYQDEENNELNYKTRNVTGVISTKDLIHEDLQSNANDILDIISERKYFSDIKALEKEKLYLKVNDTKIEYQGILPSNEGKDGSSYPELAFWGNVKHNELEKKVFDQFYFAAKENSTQSLNITSINILFELIKGKIGIIKNKDKKCIDSLRSDKKNKDQLRIDLLKKQNDENENIINLLSTPGDTDENHNTALTPEEEDEKILKEKNEKHRKKTELSKAKERKDKIEHSLSLLTQPLPCFQALYSVIKWFSTQEKNYDLRLISPSSTNENESAQEKREADVLYFSQNKENPNLLDYEIQQSGFKINIPISNENFPDSKNIINQATLNSESKAILRELKPYWGKQVALEEAKLIFIKNDVFYFNQNTDGLFYEIKLNISVISGTIHKKDIPRTNKIKKQLELNQTQKKFLDDFKTTFDAETIEFFKHIFKKLQENDLFYFHNSEKLTYKIKLDRPFITQLHTKNKLEEKDIFNILKRTLGKKIITSDGLEKVIFHFSLNKEIKTLMDELAEKSINEPLLKKAKDEFSKIISNMIISSLPTIKNIKNRGESNSIQQVIRSILEKQIGEKIVKETAFAFQQKEKDVFYFAQNNQGLCYEIQLSDSLIKGSISSEYLPNVNSTKNQLELDSSQKKILRILNEKSKEKITTKVKKIVFQKEKNILYFKRNEQAGGLDYEMKKNGSQIGGHISIKELQNQNIDAITYQHDLDKEEEKIREIISKKSPIKTSELKYKKLSLLKKIYLSLYSQHYLSETDINQHYNGKSLLARVVEKSHEGLWVDYAICAELLLLGANIHEVEPLFEHEPISFFSFIHSLYLFNSKKTNILMCEEEQQFDILLNLHNELSKVRNDVSLPELKNSENKEIILPLKESALLKECKKQVKKITSHSLQIIKDIQARKESYENERDRIKNNHVKNNPKMIDRPKYNLATIEASRFKAEEEYKNELTTLDNKYKKEIDQLNKISKEIREIFSDLKTAINQNYSANNDRPLYDSLERIIQKVDKWPQEILFEYKEFSNELKALLNKKDTQEHSIMKYEISSTFGSYYNEHVKIRASNSSPNKFKPDSLNINCLVKQGLEDIAKGEKTHEKLEKGLAEKNSKILSLNKEIEDLKRTNETLTSTFEERATGTVIEIVSRLFAEEKAERDEKAGAELEAEKAKMKAESEVKIRAELEAEMKAEREAQKEKMRIELEAEMKAEREAQKEKMRIELEAEMKAEREAKMKAELETKEVQTKAEHITEVNLKQTNILFAPPLTTMNSSDVIVIEATQQHLYRETQSIFSSNLNKKNRREIESKNEELHEDKNIILNEPTNSNAVNETKEEETKESSSSAHNKRKRCSSEFFQPKQILPSQHESAHRRTKSDNSFIKTPSFP